MDFLNTIFENQNKGDRIKIVMSKVIHIII